MLLQDVIKIFQICGYILLYSSTAIAAGLLGRGSVLIFEKCILGRLFKDGLKPYMDWIEISRAICTLMSSTAFLIVSIGLLFLNLISLLPPEYDKVAVQVVVAFLGLTVFICMCLTIASITASIVWVRLWYKKQQPNVGSADEEGGLLEGERRPSYGTGDCDHAPVVWEESTARQHKPASSIRIHRTNSQQPLPPPQRTSIKMINLSSVRDLDLRRTQSEMRPSGNIFPRGRSVG